MVWSRIRMEASKCPKCGDEPHYVETVEKWYCYGCNSYIEDEEHHHEEAGHTDSVPEEHAQEIAEELRSLEEEDAQICKKCGAELEHIKDGKLYCYICEAYPEEIKEGPEEEPKTEPKVDAKKDEPVNDAKALLDSIPEPAAISMTIAPVLDEKQEPVTMVIPEQMVQKQAEIKMCSTCGQPLKWIEKYQRNYCYGCRKYAAKEILANPEPLMKHDDNGHKRCPDCSGELKFIEKYNEFYCFSCKKYPLREKKGTVRANKPDADSCPKCGGSLKYIEKYQRHYCNSCKEYAPKSNGQTPAEKKVCPSCSSEMKYVAEYNEWYCYKCKKYSLRPAKPVLLF
jgi:predicted RNA-binding Zn-ribbon protein involved in translation (DUF1610 family)